MNLLLLLFNDCCSSYKLFSYILFLSYFRSIMSTGIIFKDISHVAHRKLEDDFSLVIKIIWSFLNDPMPYERDSMITWLDVWQSCDYTCLVLGYSPLCFLSCYTPFYVALCPLWHWMLHDNSKSFLQPYLHESRHQHALRRARGCGGRFLNAKKKENQEHNEVASGDKSQSNINLNSDKNDIVSSND